MERRPYRSEPGLDVLRRLLQGQAHLPQELPVQPTRYVPTDSHGDISRLTRCSIDFKFVRPLYHPNIYPDGRLCISILHPPGDDEMSGELAQERWTPVQRVESVVISILTLLDDPEVSSPANVDAGVMLRNNPARYKEMVTKDLELARQDIPAGFVMPTHESAFMTKKDEGDFDMSWEDSDVESFGGSESDVDEEMDSDFEGYDDEDEEEAEAEAQA